MRVIGRQSTEGWPDPGQGGHARRYVVAAADPAHLDPQQAALGNVRRGRRGLRESTTCVARAAPGDCQMSLVLHGFRYGVYVRIARIALVEKGLPYYSSPGRRRSLSPLHQTFRMVAGHTRAEES